MAMPSAWQALPGKSAAGGGAAFSPALVFPPAPPFPRPPLFFADHWQGGQPIPVSVVSLPPLGANTRRPFSFSGPPPFGSPPLTEHPLAPAVLRGRIARSQRLAHEPHRKGSVDSAGHARTSCGRAARIRALPCGSPSSEPSCSKRWHETLAHIFHTMETFFPWYGKMAKIVSMVWKTDYNPC